MKDLSTTLILLAALAAATPARAQAVEDHLENPAAEAHWQKALAAFASKNLEHAIIEITAAYQIEPATFLLYAWAQAERMSGDCTNAVIHYRKYLASDQISEKSRDATKGFIAQCEEKNLMPAQRQDDPPPKPPVRRPWFKDPLVIGVGGGGVLGIAVGIGFLASASSHHTAAGEATMLGQYNSELAATERNRVIGGVALTLGVALAAGGVYFYITRHRGKETVVTTDGRTISLAGRF